MKTGMIELKGELHPGLEILGLKPGDQVHAEINDKNNAAYFRVFCAIWVDCVVYPDNYDLVV